MKRSATIVANALFWVFILALAAMSILSRNTLNRLIPGTSNEFDYFLHFVTFIPLPMLALVASNFMQKRATWWLLFTTATLFSIASELLQLLSNGRRFNPFDIYANAVGLIIGLLIAVVVYQVSKRKC